MKEKFDAIDVTNNNVKRMKSTNEQAVLTTTYSDDTMISRIKMGGSYTQIQ